MLSPQVNRLKAAVARCVEPGVLVVGCSGGPDSLALVAAARWHEESTGQGLAVVVVDHGLQVDSAAMADRAADACRAIGVHDVEVVRVEVGSAGGPEAAARSARRSALVEAAHRRGSSQILLAHTKDDQAETVLLRLARGSGARSLAAMRSCDPPWHRPFLGIDRGLVHGVADEVFVPLGFTPWQDPHNQDTRFARVRVRRAMDQLEEDLGPGIGAGLARTADLLADDADALDTWANGEFARIVTVEGNSACAEVSALAELPRAVRTRVIRLMHATAAGPTRAGDLTFDHVQSVEALVSRWRGQGPTRLPGPVLALVDCGRLCVGDSTEHETIQGEASGRE